MAGTTDMSGGHDNACKYSYNAYQQKVRRCVVPMYVSLLVHRQKISYMRVALLTQDRQTDWVAWNSIRDWSLLVLEDSLQLSFEPRFAGLSLPLSLSHTNTPTFTDTLLLTDPHLPFLLALGWRHPRFYIVSPSSFFIFSTLFYSYVSRSFKFFLEISMVLIFFIYLRSFYFSSSFWAFLSNSVPDSLNQWDVFSWCQKIYLNYCSTVCSSELS